MPKRIPWTPLLISVAVLLSGGFAVQPVRDVASLADVAEAFLVRPGAYVALAPLSNVLDTLTLLSVRQHIALALGIIVVFLLSRGIAALLVRPRLPLRSDAIAAGVLVLAIVLAYVAAPMLPRPMANLEASDAHVLRVDFHSHTSASHDGRGGWSAGRNRAWHSAAGYDVAYVTDHATVVEAEKGMAANPNPATEGVTLLQAIEVTWTGEHVAILGAQRMYKGLLTPNLRDVDEQSLHLASLLPGREPVVIWNHPRQLNRLPIASGPGSVGVRAIEIVNGAPDGMDEVRPKRAQIAALAESRNVALTGGSDNHGWGRTAPAWTLMRIVGWRGMQGDSLAFNIERVFREGGFRSTRVVERRVADPGSSKLQLFATVFTVPARMLTTLSNDERFAWLLWTWGIFALLRWRRRSS